MADIRRAVSEFVNQVKELFQHMRTSERDSLTAIDLHVLLAQMHLLKSEAVNLQQKVATSPFDNLPEPPVTP